ncbi:SGNH/GDSL hydrolase family protein [Nibrella saemangeumensis]|uniref:SGNH/GDSL hydrolase family protein n=1 Tax=Nibrella saemangeumensis TaxID=1084526 RepID=A0ABP8N9C9_9BACT
MVPPFQAEILAFEAKDLVSPPPKNAILFTGSSSIRLWDNLQESFPDKVVLNRGFGGSSLPDVIRYADRIIIPYRPKQIVLYAGENDVASGKVSAQEACDRFVTLFRKIRKDLPKTPIVFISMKPSPSRRQYFPVILEANRLIKDFLAKQRRTTYVDVYTPMLNSNGQPKGKLFKADSLHMNPKGYVIWAEKLRPVLK